MGSLSEEEQRFAYLLQVEFERDGIQLPEKERDLLRAMNSTLVHLETMFGRNMMEQERLFQVPSSAVENMPTDLWAHLPQAPRGLVNLSTEPRVVQPFLRLCPDPDMRKAVYETFHATTQANVPVLEDLIWKRYEAAHRLGFKSHGHKVLHNTIASDTDSATAFLEAVTRGVQPQAQSEVEALLELKCQVEGPNAAPELHQWDLPFYMGLAKSMADVDNTEVSRYFPVERLEEGLVTLCKRLFQIEAEVSDAPPGETWAKGVRKLTLRHPSQGPLGIVYLDLAPRQGKYGHAAHFTVRCGRAITAEEALELDEHHHHEGYQLPIVTLVMNIGSGSGTRRLASHGELETLLHEFGHAMHSLLSRTQFQHLSGTRGASDFIETPSQLFEYFAWDQTFLGHFTEHERTGSRQVPQEILDALLHAKTMHSGINTLQQVLLARFDQGIFGTIPPKGTGEGSAIGQLAREIHLTTMPTACVPPSHDVHWWTRFGHLTTYGGTYYSYLLDKGLAAQIWHSPRFRNDGGPGLNPEMFGEVVWHELLRPGASVHPTTLLRTTLGGRDPAPEKFYEHK